MRESPYEEGRKHWYRVASSLADLQLNEAGLAEVRVGDKIICISVQGNRVAACVNSCPHAGGRLVDGFVDQLGNIVCPLHRYRFSMKNGYNVSGEGYHLKVYAVRNEADGIWVGIDQSSSINTSV